MADQIFLYVFVAMAIGLLGLVVMLTRSKGKKPKIKFDEPSIVPAKKSEWADSEKPEVSSDQTVETVKRAGFSADVVLIAAALAGFLCFLYAYINPQGAIFALIIGSMTFLPIGVLIGGLFSGSFRIKIMRRFMRKNYGFVKFIHSNRLIKPVLANLDSDMIRFGDGVYFINKNMIKREGKEGYSTRQIKDTEIKFEEGIPVIYFDIGDIIPVDFEHQGTSVDDKFRNPSQVSATLNKEIAVEKAKVMKAFKSQQNTMMIIMIAMLAAVLFFTYTLYTGNQKTLDTMASLKAAVDAIRAYLATPYPG